MRYDSGVAAIQVPGSDRLTFRDWLGFPDNGQLYEVLEGELLVTPPPGIEHQRLSRDLGFELLLHLRSNAAGEVLNAPVGVRLSDNNVFEPDLLIVLRQHADRISKQAVMGPPDLVVEILSPGTARRDLGPKRAAYERNGVTEYWIVDPHRESIEVLALSEGTYQRHGLFQQQDTLTSRVLPSLEIDLSRIFVHRRLK